MLISYFNTINTIDSKLSLQKRVKCLYAIVAAFCVSNLCSSVYQHSVPISFAPHQKPKDPHLALFVCALVAVDVVILLLFTLVEGVQGNLEPSMVPNTENPSDMIGVSMIQAREVEQSRLLHC